MGLDDSTMHKWVKTRHETGLPHLQKEYFNDFQCFDFVVILSLSFHAMAKYRTKLSIGVKEPS